MKTVMVHIINNEWYLTYDKVSLSVGEAMYVDRATSVVLGENVGVMHGITYEELCSNAQGAGLIGDITIHKTEQEP